MGTSNSQTKTELKRMAVPWFVVLSFITGLIYYPVWFLRRRQAINALQSSKKLKSGFLIVAIVLFSLNLLMSQGSDVDAQEVGGTLALIAVIIMIVQSFKVRRIFEDHCNMYLQQSIDFSGVATFFFGAFYLQYKINRLGENLSIPVQQTNSLPISSANDSAREKEIIKLAQRKGGKLTTLEIVAETSMSSGEVEKLMKELTVSGYVGMQVSDTGAIFYEFYGLGEKGAVDTVETSPLKTEEDFSSSETFASQQASTHRSILKTEVNGIVFELKNCLQQENSMKCYCEVISQYHDCELIIGAARMFDSNGNEYHAGNIQIANKSGKDKVENVFVTQIRTTTVFSFLETSQRIESIPLLEFVCTEVSSRNNFKIQFRCISVSA